MSAPAGCTPGAGCRLLQRVPGVTHHSPPPVSGPRSPDLIGARARVAAAPHPATARLEAINCYLIGSVSLSNSCVPVNALQNFSSPPMMHVHLPIWVVQRSPLSGPTIINLNMSHPSQVFSSCQFFARGLPAAGTGLLEPGQQRPPPSLAAPPTLCTAVSPLH